MDFPWGRDGHRSLQQLDDVMAVRLVPDDLGLGPRRRLAARDVQRLFGERVSPAAAVVDPRASTWTSFESAGFEFVRPLEGVRALAQGAGELRGARGAYPVALDEGGRVVLLTGHYAFEVEPDADVDAVIDRLGQAGHWPQRVLRLGAARVVMARVASTHEVAAVAGIVRREPILLEGWTGRFRPTDPRYPEQWQWSSDGRNGGRVGADVSAEAAWEVARGAGRRIAVIDAGFHLHHPDLVGAWRRAAWFEQSGIAADLRVIDAGSVGAYPVANHGTEVAGMAVERTPTGSGGCGLAFEAEWRPIACLTDQVGTQLTLARALAYAADPRGEEPGASEHEGSDVAVCSLGPNAGPWRLSRMLELAIDAAVTRGRGGLGMPVFWAVANAEVPIADDEICADPRIIAVGRSNRLDVADGSAFGPELDFLAPGVEILTTSDGDKHRVATGTSYAAPVAAAAAALVLERMPDLTWDAVRDRLRQSCRWLGSGARPAAGRDDRQGYGRIDAADALR